jgi:hypothetical protein
MNNKESKREKAREKQDKIYVVQQFVYVHRNVAIFNNIIEGYNITYL